MTIRAYLEIAAAIVLAIAFGLYTVHERHEGQAAIKASDAKAEAAAKALADAETKHAQDLSNQAEQAARNEQKTVDNYAISHPIGPVRLCNQDTGSAGVPKASTAHSGATSPSTGPDPIPAVSRGPDLGPGLSELMLDAARLASIDREWQQR